MSEWIMLDRPTRIRDFGDSGNPGLKPGMLFELEDGNTLLVGHINPNGGTCSCCDWDDAKAVGYRIIL